MQDCCLVCKQLKFTFHIERWHFLPAAILTEKIQHKLAWIPCWSSWFILFRCGIGLVLHSPAVLKQKWGDVAGPANQKPANAGDQQCWNFQQGCWLLKYLLFFLKVAYLISLLLICASSIQNLISWEYLLNIYIFSIVCFNHHLFPVIVSAQTRWICTILWLSVCHHQN